MDQPARLVFIGAPGSGKSTVVNRVVASWLDERRASTRASLLPSVVERETLTRSRPRAEISTMEARVREELSDACLSADGRRALAAVEAQATLASLVKVSALANGVDVDVFHNAVLDVPAVVEIAELGASNDLNEGGTASLGAPREAPMAQVRTASVDLVASEVFGAAPVDFLKIDVEGVEIPALRASLGLLGRGGVREGSVEFGPARRWEDSEKHGVAGANPAAAVDVLHKIDATGYDAYLTWGKFCVPPLNATGDLADEAFARECQLELVNGGVAHPCRK